MRISETYKMQQPQVLKGLFKSEKAIYRAQAVLTDYGYPKDATKVMEVDGRWFEFKAHCQNALHSVKNRFLVGTLIVAVVAVVTGVITQARSFSMMSFFEAAILLIAWAAFAVLAVLVCTLIGAVLMLGIYTFVADENEANANGEENVLISVAVSTPADARDIAREWEEIGGKVV